MSPTLANVLLMNTQEKFEVLTVVVMTWIVTV
jgi:hypothetical protein